MNAPTRTTNGTAANAKAANGTATKDPARTGRTLLERLVEAGITEARAAAHVRGGWVRVDGRIVTDPAATTVPGARVELRAIPWSESGSAPS
jgi:hypothetical protein